MQFNHIAPLLSIPLPTAQLLLSLNHNLTSVIKPNHTEQTWPDYTDSTTVYMPQTFITIPDGYSIFTLDFIILAINSLSFKLPITLWGIYNYESIWPLVQF